MFYKFVISLFRYFQKPLNIICEFIPQMIFLSAMFGYLVILIFVKWTHYDSTTAGVAPSLLIGKNILLSMIKLTKIMLEVFFLCFLAILSLLPSLPRCYFLLNFFFLFKLLYLQYILLGSYQCLKRKKWYLFPKIETIAYPYVTNVVIILQQLYLWWI